MSVQVVDYIHQFRATQMPDQTLAMAKRCVLDLIGVAAAGSTTAVSQTTRRHAARFYGSDAGPRLFFDGRAVNPLGAALANATTIDSMDAHDGHPVTKGHAGCGLLPGLVALLQAENKPVSGLELLGLVTLGYEVAIRDGMALHNTVADYHTSGAWVAVAVAGLGGRILGLDAERTAHAMGIAEYHGPRSQMMRCIEFPTMLKDGSGWGAFVGVSAAYLAEDGYSGAPAITTTADDVSAIWSDLGQRWMITEQYFKPYPVCRWAQPAIEGVTQLQAAHGFDAHAVDRIDVTTFSEAAALATYVPSNTEQAQYSLPFPVAAKLLRGDIGPWEVGPAGFTDPAILAMSHRVKLHVSDEFNARFPAERLAQVTITLNNGQSFATGEMVAHGNQENPMSDAEIEQKFHNLLAASGAESRSESIVAMVDDLEGQDDVSPLFDAMCQDTDSD